MNRKKIISFILCMLLVLQMGFIPQISLAEEISTPEMASSQAEDSAQQIEQTPLQEEGNESPNEEGSDGVKEGSDQKTAPQQVELQTPQDAGMQPAQQTSGEEQQEAPVREEGLQQENPGSGDVDDVEGRDTSEDEEDTDAEEDADYLETLDVYNNTYGTGDARTITRHKELDETFDGRVYMVDYGSTWTSNNFYVAAKLSEAAPEGSEINMSACNLSGEMKSVKIIPSTDKRINRRSLQDKTIFGSDENGAKRAVYTITAGTEEKSQIYKIIVNRVPELSSLKCYTEDELNDILEEKFNKDVRQYTGAVSAEDDEVKVKASAIAASGFDITINGEAYEAGKEKTLSVPEITNEIRLRLSKTETYADPEYAEMTYESVGEYGITVRRSVPAEVKFTTDPTDTIVCVYDRKGDRVYSKEGTTTTFLLLTEETYTYNASCYGHKSVQGEFQAQMGMTVTVELEEAVTKHDELTNNEWWNYRNNEENNGVTSVSTPENADEVTEKWAIHLGGDWSSSFTPPLILGGAIYTASEKFMYKIDKDTGEILATSEELKGSMGFALNPLTYAEGMIFAQVGNGQIQALDATTLESVWISEPLGGQTLSPISYKNGYIYSGTWNSEIEPGTYFCLSVTDEDPERKDEIKYCTWKYSHKGGFYWAGSYVSDDYAVFGSDDGTQEGNYTDNSILYSVSAKDGIIIDKIEGLRGDIRTSVVYDNGYVYVATKGGYLYRVKMNDDGSFGDMTSCKLGGMATASPVVYKNRIYIGVCGTGGQFNADGGHNFTVLNQTEQGLSVAYTVPINGYPQAGALLSTAYEDEDYNKDGKPDGRVYVYFTYNAFPGGIMGFTDSPGQTSGRLETYFEPEPDKQQYCISPLCIGSDGIIYYKNDSCYLMAIESNSAYLKDIKAKASSSDVSWDAEFKKSRHEYGLKVVKGTETVTLTLVIPQGRKVTVNGKSCNGTYIMRLEDGKAEAEILVRHDTKSRVYRIKVEEISQDAALAELLVSSNNNVNNVAGRIGLDKEFAPQQQEYVSDIYEGSNAFLNIYAVTANENAKMEIKAVSGIEKINRYKSGSGSKTHTRFAIYFGENESRAVVEITVTAADGVTKLTYRVTLQRTDIYAPKLTDIIVTRTAENTGFLTFEANEAGGYYYSITESGRTSADVDLSQPATALSEGSNRLELTKLDRKGNDIYITAVDALGNMSQEPYKISVKPYKTFQQTISANRPGTKITIKDTAGNPVKPVNDRWTLIDGNTYYVIIEAEGYETLETTIVADATVSDLSYELVSKLSSNAFLNELLVSSSEQLGSGLLKLSPAFEKEVANYSASYGKERSHLTLWAMPEDQKAHTAVYAVSGVKGATVNKDETISGEKLEDGRYKWDIYFGKGQTSVKVRVQVTAEDGTKKNYFVSLSIEDKTPPKLSRVSTSRISADRASVVFKTSEKGTYHYDVVEKGQAEPVIGREKGEDVLEGTVTISLNGLKKGAKDIYIVMTDHAGNESETLKMEIPDSKTPVIPGNSGNEGNSDDPEIPEALKNDALSGKPSLITRGLTGKASSSVLKKLTSKDGDKSKLKKNENRVTKKETEVEQKDNGSAVLSALLGTRGKPDLMKCLMLAAAGVGLAYLIFWGCSCSWYKRRKQKLKAYCD